LREAEDHWILRDVSFTVPAGNSCALVGPTGGGKTTIINLLLRFYDPQRGRILIDGVDLRRLRSNDLRRRIGVVPQDIYLFPGDLAENLALGRNCTDAELHAAARTTLAEPLIEQLPGGMHASLYERGANLSVGQRQLLSFTRALVSTPELLVLDEATSAVDPATEALLGDATRRLLLGRTSLIIAHRLSTIRHCDEILVVQQGRIAERGTHDQLVAAGGVYRELSELQRSSGAVPHHDGG
jgi:ATP-binding cassette subfamily B protein